MKLIQIDEKAFTDHPRGKRTSELGTGGLRQGLGNVLLSDHRAMIGSSIGLASDGGTDLVLCITKTLRATNSRLSNSRGSRRASGSTGWRSSPRAAFLSSCEILPLDVEVPFFMKWSSCPIKNMADGAEQISHVEGFCDHAFGFSFEKSFRVSRDS